MAKICIKKATTKCEMDDFVRLHRKLYVQPLSILTNNTITTKT